MKSRSYINLYPISSSGGVLETSINDSGIYVSGLDEGVNPSNVRMGAFKIGQDYIAESLEYLIVDLNQGGGVSEAQGTGLVSGVSEYRNVSKYSAVIVEGSLSISSSSPSNPQNKSTYFFTHRFITDHFNDDNFGEDVEMELISPSNTTNNPNFLEFSSPPFSLGYNNTTKQVTFKYTPNAFATNKFTVAKGIYTLI